MFPTQYLINMDYFVVFLINGINS